MKMRGSNIQIDKILQNLFSFFLSVALAMKHISTGTYTHFVIMNGIPRIDAILYLNDYHYGGCYKGYVQQQKMLSHTQNTKRFLFRFNFSHIP